LLIGVGLGSVLLKLLLLGLGLRLVLLELLLLLRFGLGLWCAPLKRYQVD